MENNIQEKAQSTSNMSFSAALFELKSRKTVSRAGWKNSSIKVLLQVPDENSKMTLPYLYMEKEGVEGEVIRFPLDLSTESIMAEDWYLV